MYSRSYCRQACGFVQDAATLSHLERFIGFDPFWGAVLLDWTHICMGALRSTTAKSPTACSSPRHLTAQLLLCTFGESFEPSLIIKRVCYIVCIQRMFTGGSAVELQQLTAPSKNEQSRDRFTAYNALPEPRLLCSLLNNTTAPSPQSGLRRRVTSTLILLPADSPLIDLSSLTQLCCITLATIP